VKHEPDWRGIAAVVLSVGVVAVVIIGEFLGFHNSARLVSTEEVATVSTVLGAAIGAVAGYLGRLPRDPPGGKNPDAPP
jgi:hypothetical protein